MGDGQITFQDLVEEQTASQGSGGGGFNAMEMIQFLDSRGYLQQMIDGNAPQQSPPQKSPNEVGPANSEYTELPDDDGQVQAIEHTQNPQQEQMDTKPPANIESDIDLDSETIINALEGVEEWNDDLTLDDLLYLNQEAITALNQIRQVKGNISIEELNQLVKQNRQMIDNNI